MCEINKDEWRDFKSEKEKNTLKPIGVIHTPFKQLEKVPSQAYMSDKEGEIEVFPEYVSALKGVEDFTHITVLFLFHKADGYCLQVNRCMDGKKHGLFVTRAPYRPNPIGLTTVRLLRVKGNRLRVRGLDMLDGTPLLDIKPFVPRFDNQKDANMGWFKEPMDNMEYLLWQEKVFRLIERFTGVKIKRKEIKPP